MIIFKAPVDIHFYLTNLKKEKIATGFVPTMGALHQGHIGLIEKAKSQVALVICSIFINPTQFNDPKDFDKYPTTIEQDIYQLEKAGCDLLFLPSVESMYPNGSRASFKYEIGNLETMLEGKFRPGHFQGVCQVLHRLLNVIVPEHLFLGQKDFQQCMVIKRLIQLLNLETQVVICPTERELNGLAMSSRNARLNENEKETAKTIYESLRYINDNIAIRNINQLKSEAGEMLSSRGFKVDYVEVADINTLTPVKTWDGVTPLVALVAAYLNEVRLIDNLLLSPDNNNL
jgi:pantoate--beta-alanine ligase